MPVVINEIVIKTNVDSTRKESGNTQPREDDKVFAENIVKEAVEKVLEILAHKRER